MVNQVLEDKSVCEIMDEYKPSNWDPSTEVFGGDDLVLEWFKSPVQ